MSADCIQFVWEGVNLGRDCRDGDLSCFHLWYCFDAELEVGMPWQIFGFGFGDDPNNKVEASLGHLDFLQRGDF